MALGSAGLVFGGLAWHGERAARARFDLEARWEALATRPLEGRLAGLETYKPYRPTRPAPHPPVVAELGGPYRGPRQNALASRDENKRVLATLLEGRGCPSAVKALAALTQSPEGANSWQAWNNLAAAHLACAPTEPEKAGQALESHLAAIEAATQALELEPTASEAAFNRALGLGWLPLPHQARAAWERYLELDPSSEWADEARARQLTRSPAPDFEESRTAQRHRAERELLPAWTAALATGDEAGAAKAWLELEPVLAELGPQGDVIAAAVVAVREAKAQGDQQRLALLAAGHRAFAEGVALHRAEHASKAVLRLGEAATSFERAGSPFTLRAKLRKLWATGKPPEPELRKLIRELEAADFAFQAAEAWRLLAMRTTLEGRVATAVEQHRESELRLRLLGVWEEAAVAQGMRAECLSMLARHTEASADSALALAAAPLMSDPWHRYSVYWIVSAALRPVFPRAATELLREAVSTCDALPERPLCAVDTSTALARGLPSLAEVRSELAEATRALEVAPDSDGKARTRLDLLRAEASRLTTDPSAGRFDLELALEKSEEAITGYEARDLPISASRVRVFKADALARLERWDEERAELAAALAHLRVWDQTKLRDVTAAEAPSPTELRELFERLIAHEDDRFEALLLAEEMHDRLAPRLAPDYSPPTREEVDGLLLQIPEGTALAEYALLSSRNGDGSAQAVSWVMHQGTLDEARVELPESFRSQIEALHHAATRKNLAEWEAASRELHLVLVEPMRRLLPAKTRRLVVVPDRELHALPFRGLLSSATGRYLDEDFSVSLAVSARAVLQPTASRFTRPPSADEVLSVGFEKFPGLGLEELPHAAKEARAIGEIYGQQDGEGCAATDWQALRECLPGARVVHLATHATASPRRAGWSWLALPNETVDLAKLWDELPDLSQAELVVLSSCESVAGSGSGEGLGGLARPFLAKGAQAVVGTLWRIDDTKAAAIFTEFHFAFRESGDAAEALRPAREVLPQWMHKPWDWAGVAVVAASLE